MILPRHLPKGKGLEEDLSGPQDRGYGLWIAFTIPNNYCCLDYFIV
jgi:hypothetical protein